MLVVQAFSNHHIIPWHLQNRWQNILNRFRNMRFHVSHIYIEWETIVLINLLLLVLDKDVLYDGILFHFLLSLISKPQPQL